METRQEGVNQLWLSFMYLEPASRNLRHSAAMSQAEVARKMKTTQTEVALLEKSAFDKLRANPEVKRLMKYVCQQNSRSCTPAVEPTILRKLGAAPEDTTFMTLHGFAPNL